VRLRLLPDSYSVCDPIRLFLVMALRSGNVIETSITDLLSTTRKSRNPIIAWIDPTRPVICISSCNHVIDFTRSAPADQLRQFLKHASELIGLLKEPGAHALRRGATFETSCLPSTHTVDSVDRVAKLLGHSGRAGYDGLTARYIGGAVESRFEERFEKDFSEITVRAPEQAPVGYFAKRLSTAEINAYIAQHSVVDATQIDRKRAAKLLAKEKKEEWVQANSPSMSEEENERPGSSTPVSVVTWKQREGSTKIQIVQNDRMALFTTPPRNLVIISIVCGSTASFLPWSIWCSWGITRLRASHARTRYVLQPLCGLFG
jgi:hypothetical protein